jgi:phage N-6-adenine-methyltransferase
LTNDSRACFTSKRPDWATPPDLFARLDAEFHFTLDVCATADNAKCARYFSPEEDGLRQSWGRNTCWMNPPYGRGMEKWIVKAWEASWHSALVVALVPARTEMGWFHTYVLGIAEIRYIRGRLRFVGSRYNAPFPSILIIWRPT